MCVIEGLKKCGQAGFEEEGRQTLVLFHTMCPRQGKTPTLLPSAPQYRYAIDTQNYTYHHVIQFTLA